MKKRLGILVLIFMMITLSACSGANGAETTSEPAASIEKDVTMLLKGIGDSMDMVTSLGDLPEAQVNGNLHYFQNANTEGYFAGFDLGVETEADGQTVKQIYIQPIGDARITANGLAIGGTITDTKAAFGDGELSSVEQNGKIVNFMTFVDDTYVMKATVADQKIVAVAFTKAGAKAAEQATEPTDEAKADDQDSSTAAEPDKEAEIANEEMAHLFDFLLDFIGKDFGVVEQALGSDYSRSAEEYEDVAVFEEEGFTFLFSMNQETDVVTTVMLNYDSIHGTIAEPMGMAGVLMGIVMPRDTEYEFAYGDAMVYIMIDCNDVIYGLQATSNMPQPESETEAPAPGSASGEGYEISIEQFDTYSILSIIYAGTGDKVELVNTKGRTDGDRMFDGIDVKILNAKASKDGKTIYFETDDPKMTSGYGASNNTIFKYDLNNGYEENLCLGFLYDTVKVSPYEDCIIINYYEPNPRGGYYEPFVLIDGEANYHFMGTELEADLADQIRRAYNDEIDKNAMETPEKENIYGQVVDFERYSAVVVEDYQGKNKAKFVREQTIQNPYYKDDGHPLYPNTFAVFGTIYNLRWEVGIAMGESKIYSVADQMTDTYVTYETRRPGDMSVDTFLFEDKNGTEYRIVIEDMSDNIDLVLIP